MDANDRSARGSIPGYRLLEKIAEGGMGEIYKAEDETLGRIVALKFVKARDRLDAAARRRLMEEARAASALEHPNICSIHTVGETDDGELFIAMGYHEGESLRDLIGRGPIDEKKALDMFFQAGRGLQAAHEKGIVHRDIKPENLFLLPDGSVKILDFGLAKAPYSEDTFEYMTAGTLSYMSPERIRGEASDGRSDIWSLGVVLFEMLGGSPPFTGDYPQALSYSIQYEEADVKTRLPHVSGATAELISACLRKQAADRPAYIEQPAPQAAIGEAGGGPGSLKRRLLFALLLTALAAIAWPLWKPYILPVKPGRGDSMRLAVFPFENQTGEASLDGIPELVQQMLVHELTGRGALVLTDPLSLNSKIHAAFGSTEPDFRESGFRDFLEEEGILNVITGSISRTTTGYLMQTRVVNENGEVEYAAAQPLANENALPEAVRSMASQIADHFMIAGQVRADSSVQPWLAGKARNLQAQLAFLEARRIIYRGESAEKELRRTLRYDSTFISARIWLISNLLYRPNRNEARRQYKILLRQERLANPFERAMIQYVGALIDDRQPEQQRYLEIALEYSPGNHVLLINLAELAVAQGDYEKALGLAMPCVQARWKYAPVYPIAAFCALALDRVEQAASIIEHNWDICSPYPGSSAARAAIAARRSRADTTEIWEQRYVTACLERFASLDSAYGSLADHYAAARLHSRAEAIALKAVSMKPDKADHYLRLGRAYSAQGRAAEADTAFSRAVELRPGYAAAHYERAQLYENNQEMIGAALADYLSFAAADSTSFRAYEARKRIAALRLILDGRETGRSDKKANR